MINLIKINLLPYREALQQKRKQQFKVLMLVAGAIGVGLAALTYVSIDQMIAAQEARNQFLTTKTQELDKEIASIADLQKEKATFLARKQKVEELQSKRFEGAHIIDTINRLVPEGVYLTSVTASGNTEPIKYEIKGKAASDNRIAMFMRTLPSTGLFQLPELSSIKKEETAQDFVLSLGVAGVPQAPVSGLMNPAEISASQEATASAATSQTASQPSSNLEVPPASPAESSAPAN